MQPLRGVDQKPLDRLCLALTVGVFVIDGTRLLVLIRAVGEADVVKLDLVEAQRGGLQRQLHLVLPHGAVVGAGPVHGTDLQGRAVQVGDDIFRVVGGQVGVVEHRDAADDVVAGVAELLHVGLEALHGVLGRGIGGRAVLLHDRGGVGYRRAVHDVHHKGIDAGTLRQPDIAVRVLNGAAIQVQRPHLVGHHIVREGRLLRGVVVQAGRVAAAPGVAPRGVALVERVVILRQRFLLCHADVLSVDVPLAPVTADGPAQDLAVFVQAVKAGDGQRHALFHRAAGDRARFVRQAHAPQGVDGIGQHRAVVVCGQVGRVQIGVALAVDHADAVRAVLGVLNNVLYLRTADQGTQLSPVFVIHRGGGPGGGHIARRRLRHHGIKLPPDDISQRAQRQQAQHDEHHRRAGVVFLFRIR